MIRITRTRWLRSAVALTVAALLAGGWLAPVPTAVAEESAEPAPTAAVAASEPAAEPVAETAAADPEPAPEPATEPAEPSPEPEPTRAAEKNPPVVPLDIAADSGEADEPIVAAATDPGDETAATPAAAGGGSRSARAARAAAAGSAPTLTIDWAGSSPATQEVGNAFVYSLKLSCSAVVGETCDADSVTVSLPPAPFPTAAGATPITDWLWRVSEGGGVVSEGAPASRTADSLTWSMLRPLASGESLAVPVSATPPVGPTPNDTTWDAGVTVALADGEDLSADPVAYTATADTTFWASKSANRPQAMPGATTVYSVRTGFGGTLNLVGDLALVDQLPEGAEFVSASDGGIYDPDSHAIRWELGCDSDCRYDSWEPTVTVRWAADAAPGQYLNHASAEASFVGEDTPRTASADAGVEIVETLPASTDGWGKTAHKVGSTAAEVGLDDPALYELKLPQQPIAADWRLADPIPCLDEAAAVGSATRYSSLYRDVICANPAVDVQTAKLSAGTGQATVVYSDGSTADFSVGTSAVVIGKPGARVAQVDVALSVPAGNGETTVTLGVVVPSGVAVWHSSDTLTNRAWASTAAAGSGEWSPWSPAQADLTLLLGTLFADNVPLPDYAWTVDPGGWEPLPNYGWATASDPAVEDAIRRVTVVPAGLAVRDREAAADGTTTLTANGWSGDSRFEVSRANRGTFELVQYVGFPGQPSFLLDGQPLSKCSPWWAYDGGQRVPAEGVGEYLVDTSGLLGPDTAGQPTAVCRYTYKVTILSAAPSFALAKFVRGDGDTDWQPSPGTTRVATDGTGIASFRWEFTNTGSKPFTGAVLYDLLPRVGDTGILLTSESRGSTFTPTLAAVPADVAGWSWAYSHAANPCRPEVLAANPGCVDDWSAEPGDLGSVTALRLTATADVASAATSTFEIAMATPPRSANDVAWNTVAAGVEVDGDDAPLPAEAPKVGFGRIAGEPIPDPEPTPTPEPEPTPEPTPSVTPTPSPTPEPAPTPSATPTPQPDDPDEPDVPVTIVSGLPGFAAANPALAAAGVGLLLAAAGMAAAAGRRARREG